MGTPGSAWQRHSRQPYADLTYRPPRSETTPIEYYLQKKPDTMKINSHRQRRRYLNCLNRHRRPGAASDAMKPFPTAGPAFETSAA